MKKYVVFLMLVCFHTYIFVSQESLKPNLERRPTYLQLPGFSGGDSSQPSRDHSSTTGSNLSISTTDQGRTVPESVITYRSDSESSQGSALIELVPADDLFEFRVSKSDVALERCTAMRPEDFEQRISSLPLAAPTNTPVASTGQ